MQFFTNVRVYGGSILHRYVEVDSAGNVRRKTETSRNFMPTIFTTSKKQTGWKNLYGVDVLPKSMNSISEAKEWLRDYGDVHGIEIHGNNDFEAQFIAENYSGKISFDMAHIRTQFIDIEVTVGEGFPSPLKAEQEITAITVYDSITKTYFVFGCGDFSYEKFYEIYGNDDFVIYNQCPNEKNLLSRFVNFLKSTQPDIITGWNIAGFDIPYIINRLVNIFGEDYAKTISPWNKIDARTSTGGMYKNEVTTYDIWGIEVLDYLELYKKYVPKNQESYSLGYISQEELGESKVEFEGSLNDLYRNNHQQFIEYNIIDVKRVVQLDAKLKMIQLQVDLAYRAKLNYSDAFGPVKLWTSIIFHKLWEEKKVLPPKRNTHKDGSYEGAYVIEPKIGLHDWVVTIDATSLYPSMIMSFNISPETIVGSEQDLPEELRRYYKRNLVQEIVESGVPPELTESLKKHNLAMTANGQFYRRDYQGILPKLVDEMFKDRKKAKTEMLSLKSKKEAGTLSESELGGIDNLIGGLSITEKGLKVCLNALYGACGNQWFHLFDIRNAEAITISGQVSLRFVSKRMSKWLSTVDKQDRDHIIAGDTDSMFLDLSGIVNSLPAGRTQDQLIDIVSKFADNSVNAAAKKICASLGEAMNMFDVRLDFKREKVITRLAYVAKKRYICMVGDSEGVRYKKPELSCTGVETNRSSTPKLMRGALEEVFETLLTKDEAAVRQYVLKLHNQFSKEPIEAIAFPRGVNGLEKYAGGANNLYIKGCPEHVKAALLYNKLLKDKGLDGKYPMINEGDKIKFIKLDPKNPTREGVIAFKEVWPKEFGLDLYIDKDLQFSTSFVEPLLAIMTKIGWSLEDKPSVEDFF